MENGIRDNSRAAGVIMKSKLRHGALGVGRGAETSNLKPQASSLSQLSQNPKADETLWIVVGVIVLVLIILLAFLLAGKISGLGNKIISGLG